MNDSKGAEDPSLPDEDVTVEDKHDASRADVDVGLDVKQPELDQESIDGGNVLEQTVTLEEGLEDSVASPDEQIEETCDVTDNQQETSKSGSPENPDGDFSFDHQQETCFGEDLEESGTQVEKCHLQQEHDLPSIDLEPDQDQNDGGDGSLFGTTATLKQSSENGSLLSNDQTPETFHDSDRQEDNVHGEVLEDELPADDDQHSEQDVDDLVTITDADHSVMSPEKLQNIALCSADDPTPIKEENSQQYVEQDSKSDMFASALTDRQEHIGFAEGWSEKDKQDQSSPVNSDVTVAVTTPSYMQLEVLTRSPLESPGNQMQVVKSGSGPGTWSEDEDKGNLLCLLDSQRRTELDQDNWQLARCIEDKMSLVKDAELDDLENVQVSVKVSRSNTEISSHLFTYIPTHLLIN